MKLTSMIASAGIILGALAANSGAIAQDYPNDIVRIVVGSSPGGTADTVSRLVAESLTEQLGQTFVVENMPGAGGALAAANVLKSKPDGYTIQFMFSSFSILPSLNKEVGYDPVEDFDPITMVISVPNVLIAHPSFGVNNLAEWTAKIQADPGKYDYGSGGIGYSQHLSMEMLLQGIDGDAVHIPYAGSGKLLGALISGEVPFAFDSLTSAAPHIEAGSVIALGITSEERSSILPDVPAIGEVIDGYSLIAWNGFVAPAGTPPEVIDTLNGAIHNFLASEKAIDFFSKVGTTISPMTPDGFAGLIESEFHKFAKLIDEAGITVN